LFGCKETDVSTLNGVYFVSGICPISNQMGKEIPCPHLVLRIIMVKVKVKFALE
jgi:hypothetical protein